MRIRFPGSTLLSVTALGLVAALAFVVPLVSQAQDPATPPPTGGLEDDAVIVLRPGQAALVRLAIPPMEGMDQLLSERAAAARELDETMRDDLEESRIFEIQGPRELSVVVPTGDRARDFEQYRALGNKMLLLGVLKPEGDGRLTFEGRLYDLGSGRSVLGKRYRGRPDAARRIAHTFADEVIYFVSGRHGIARTSIAFTSNRSGTKEIWMMDYDGANQRPVTGHKSTSMSPDFAPNGTRLAYTSFVGGSPGVYLADLRSGRKSAIATEGNQNIGPSFSPGGDQVAFSRAIGANSEIYSANVDGSNLRQLTRHGAIDTNPAWSPKGNRIAFTSSRAGNPHIYVMDADGSNLRRTSFEGTYNDGASWSPDGDALVYASRRSGKFEIVRTDLVTFETAVLTRGPGSNENPTFSPDGRRIAYTSSRSGSPQIWVMDVDGSNARRLTDEGRNETPAWSGYPK